MLAPALSCPPHPIRPQRYATHRYGVLTCLSHQLLEAPAPCTTTSTWAVRTAATLVRKRERLTRPVEASEKDVAAQAMPSKPPAENPEVEVAVRYSAR